MIKSILSAPHPVLSQPAQAISAIDKKTRQIIADMKQTLTHATNPKGVGLAAVQITIPLQIFVMRLNDSDPITVYLNPKITSYSKEVTTKREKGSHLEGCLSIPRIWGVVARSVSVTLQYMDESGQSKQELFKNFPARIVQHEVDHLKGILYTQRVLEQKGKLFHPVIDEKGKEALEEFTI